MKSFLFAIFAADSRLPSLQRGLAEAGGELRTDVIVKIITAEARIDPRRLA
jgi:hypothetical protein